MKRKKRLLRVCHYPQIPCDPFTVDVKDEEQAYVVEQALIHQHLFLFEHNIIPDYCNAIMIEMFDDGEWVDYFNDELDMDWDQYCNDYFKKQ